MTRRFLDSRLPKRNSKLAARMAEYIILGIGIFVGIYQVLNLALEAFAATLGILGIGAAFASQQIAQNLMAGIMIGLERRIQLEDWIDIGGTPDTKPARVKDITLTKSILLDPSGKLVIVPNSTIIGSKVINYTKAGFFEVPLPLTLPLNADIDKAKRIILDVADKHEKILPNLPPEEKKAAVRAIQLPQFKRLFENSISLESFCPRVLITDISNAKVTLSIRIWIREVSKKDDIVSDFLGVLFKRLREEKIDLI
ncbi:MAG: mechanosensitive ion channel family protein [Methanomassiliicoccales archaeon]